MFPDRPPQRFDPGEWGRIYDRPALTGGTFPFLRSAEMALDRCLAHSAPGEVWLDVGCGTGHLAAKISARGRRVVALDHDLQMAAAARVRTGRAGAATRLVAGAAERLPLASESVDGVLAVSLLGCLPSAAGFLREAARVLRPGGRLIATFTNGSSLLLGLRARRPAATGDAPSWMYRLYAPGEVRRELAVAGLRLVACRGYNFFVTAGDALIPGARLARGLDWLGRLPLARHLARNFVCVGRKASPAA